MTKKAWLVTGILLLLFMGLIPLTIHLGDKQIPNPVGHFVRGPYMHEIRYRHTATLLDDGNVLIAGGNVLVAGRTIGNAKTAELYLAKKNKFIQIPGLNVLRTGCAAVKIKNGKVLFIGGDSPPNGGWSDVVEEYDPTTRHFTVVGKTLVPRNDCQAVLLDNGKVFIYGGSFQDEGHWHCELYDPETNASTYTSRMHYRGIQSGHVLAKLLDGRVFIKVGAKFTPDEEEKIYQERRKHYFQPQPKPGSLGAIEIYDPKTDKYEVQYVMHEFRASVSSIVLLDGTVLLAGGLTAEGSGVINKSVEIYDPQIKKSTLVAPLSAALLGEELVLLKKRFVMVSCEEVYDIENSRVIKIGKCKNLLITKLLNGNVLITGGPSKIHRRSEVFEVTRE